MTKVDLKVYLKERATLVEKTLQNLLPTQQTFPPKIHEAIAYSVFAGGKRLRPILCLAAGEAVGGDYKPLLPVACALEMIHTYSLIHDDLPAMDDDDYRRGRLTNHKVYGEGMAVLVGDALLTYAFEILAVFGQKEAQPEVAWQVLQEIAVAAGIGGMIGGQVADLAAAGQHLLDQELLNYIHTHKTGALFRVALRSGALLAGATAKELAGLTLYAEKFGLAFQITDDLLDLFGNQAQMGKPLGRDLALKKLTYPSFYGVEKSRVLVKQAIEEAALALEKLPGETKPLFLLLDYLSEREF